jgi:hypothetical protein
MSNALSISDRLGGYKELCLDVYCDIEGSLRDRLSLSRPVQFKVGKHLGAMAGLMLSVLYIDQTLNGKNGLSKKFNLSAHGDTEDDTFDILQALKIHIMKETCKAGLIDNIVTQAAADYGIRHSERLVEGIRKGFALFMNESNKYPDLYEPYIETAPAPEPENKPGCFLN